MAGVRGEIGPVAGSGRAAGRESGRCRPAPQGRAGWFRCVWRVTVTVDVAVTVTVGTVTVAGAR